MRRMSSCGDSKIADYDPTTSPERLKEIEEEFNRFRENGWFAADITDGRNEFIDKFDPNADILMIPRMQGGCH